MIENYFWDNLHERGFGYVDRNTDLNREMKLDRYMVDYKNLVSCISIETYTVHRSLLKFNQIPQAKKAGQKAPECFTFRL